jgi:hypothetical protein
MTASDDGWAVGSDGAVIRWDGNQWSNVTGPTGAWLHCVKMTSSTEGWILGADGMYRLQLEEEETSDFPIEYLVTTAAVITIVAALVFTKKKTSKTTKQQ